MQFQLGWRSASKTLQRFAFYIFLREQIVKRDESSGLNLRFHNASRIMTCLCYTHISPTMCHLQMRVFFVRETVSINYWQPGFWVFYLHLDWKHRRLAAVWCVVGVFVSRRKKNNMLCWIACDRSSLITVLCQVWRSLSARRPSFTQASFPTCKDAAPLSIYSTHPKITLPA